MQAPVAALLNDGKRLHLQHGPIDLIIGADADRAGGRAAAFAAATTRFETILDGLVCELVQHRMQLTGSTQLPVDPVARRMYRAAMPFCAQAFLTPMAAVAGAVADEVLHAMLRSGPLSRAYVNNGGDIAVHLADGAEFSVAMAAVRSTDLGRIRFGSGDAIRGLATSGAGGRSHSLGIADSVTVLSASAAQADVAATLIANAVDLPGHSGIIREPANRLSPDSDLGARLVVTGVPKLCHADRDTALAAGRAKAVKLTKAGLITGAALFLQGGNTLVGDCFTHQKLPTEGAHA